MSSCRRDRMRVSLWNNPSAPPNTSPQASATMKVSPCLIEKVSPRSAEKDGSSRILDAASLDRVGTTAPISPVIADI